MRFGKRGFVIFFGLFVLISGGMFSSGISLTGNLSWEPPVVNNCSDVDIQTMWDSIFVESSSGITILKEEGVGGDCENFAAYKTKADGGVWVLMNTVMQEDSRVKSVELDIFYLNGPPELINEINSQTSYEFPTTFKRFSDFKNDFADKVNKRSLAFASASQEFEKYFRVPSLTLNNSEGYYSFGEEKHRVFVSEFFSGGIYADKSINLLEYALVNATRSKSGSSGAPDLVATLGSGENVSNQGVNERGANLTISDFGGSVGASAKGNESDGSGFFARENLSLVFWVALGVLVMGVVLFLIYFLVLKKRNIGVNTLPPSAPITPNPVKDYIGGLNLEKKGGLDN